MNFAKSLTAASLVIGLVSTTPTFAGEVITLAMPFGQSNVLAWSWGASNSSTTHVGGGGGAGRANFQDLSITRTSDSQSPSFVRAVATGQHYPTAILVDGPMKITLTNVLVTSISTGGVADKKSVLTENISVNFSKFKVEVGGNAFEFDIAANAIP